MILLCFTISACITAGVAIERANRELMESYCEYGVQADICNAWASGKYGDCQ